MISMTQAIESVLNEVLQTINTTIPGSILSFDPATQLAQVQVGVKRVDKKGVQTAHQPIIEVTVHFAGSSTYRIEHELNAGDEGIITFSQRCITAWRDQGGVSNNPIERFHDINDAFFTPGYRSQNKKLSDFDNNGVRITDGTNYFWLKNNGDLAIKAGNVNIESSALTHNGVNIGDDHKHAAGTYNVSGTPVTATSGDPQ